MWETWWRPWKREKNRWFWYRRRLRKSWNFMSEFNIMLDDATISTYLYGKKFKMLQSEKVDLMFSKSLNGIQKNKEDLTWSTFIHSWICKSTQAQQGPHSTTNYHDRKKTHEWHMLFNRQKKTFFLHCQLHIKLYNKICCGCVDISAHLDAEYLHVKTIQAFIIKLESITSVAFRYKYPM